MNIYVLGASKCVVCDGCGGTIGSKSSRRDGKILRGVIPWKVSKHVLAVLATLYESNPKGVTQSRCQKEMPVGAEPRGPSLEEIMCYAPMETARLRHKPKYSTQMCVEMELGCILTQKVV